MNKEVIELLEKIVFAFNDDGSIKDGYEEYAAYVIKTLKKTIREKNKGEKDDDK